MRKSIRMTGRKQLAQGSFAVQLTQVNGKRVAALTVSNPDEFKGFPADAEIRIKLAENKLVEVLRFGVIAKPSSSATVTEASFRAPSCQIRVVSRDGAKAGMLLGSTNPWTLRTGGDPDGILLFQPSNIKPRLWKLDIRDSESEQPILYVDERIPDASIWAKSDPIFTACVLPQAVSEIMRKVLSEASAPEEGWQADWLSWALALMPGSQPPFGGSDADRVRWIDDLISTFAQRHELADLALAKLTGPQP